MNICFILTVKKSVQVVPYIEGEAMTDWRNNHFAFETCKEEA